MTQAFQKAIELAAAKSPATFVASLSILKSSEIVSLIASLELKTQECVISKFPPWIFRQLLREEGAQCVAKILARLSEQDFIRAALSLSSGEILVLKEYIESSKWERIKEAFGHRESPFFKMMSSKSSVFEPNFSIAQCRYRLKLSEKENPQTIFIVDSSGQYLGACSTSKILLNDCAGKPLRAVIEEKEPVLVLGESEKNIEKLFSGLQLSDIALCSRAGLFLGSIHVKKLAEHLLGNSEKHTKSAQTMDTLFEVAGAGFGGIFDVLANQLDARGK